MNLIIDTAKLVEEFKRLTNQYSELYWTTAWAGVGSIPFDDLKKHQMKIKRLVVGIHFYQTHPDFIATFLTNKYVRYMMQPEGTFHPKVYLFTNSKLEWEVLIGSANFTASAFTCNSEAILHIKAQDDPLNNVYSQALKLMERSWKDAKVFTNTEILNYSKIYDTHRSKIKVISGKYSGQNSNPKPMYNSEIFRMTWKEYVYTIKNEKANAGSRRLKVLSLAHKLFNQSKHFHSLSLEARKFIAGMPNRFPEPGGEDWAMFGSMKGAGIYKNRIITNDIKISQALDQIPLSGQITRRNYDDFVSLFQTAFLDTRLENANNVATASRLLMMKRPDMFVCVDNANKRKLADDFRISRTNMDYNIYWEDIVERIVDCDWWKISKPTSQFEKRVYESRTALLDSLYYDWKNEFNPV